MKENTNPAREPALNYAEYINHWLDDANKLDKCNLIYRHENNSYTPVNWGVGWVHMVHVRDSNYELIIDTTRIAHMSFEKDFF